MRSAAHGRPRIGRGCRVRQNRVVLAPVAGVKSAEVFRARPVAMHRQFADDGDKTNSSPGRVRHKPLKPSRRKRRGCSGEPVLTTVCLLHFAHGPRVHHAPGVSCALSRGSRCALSSSGRTFFQNPGPSRRGIVKPYPIVIACCRRYNAVRLPSSPYCTINLPDAKQAAGITGCRK